MPGAVTTYGLEQRRDEGIKAIIEFGLQLKVVEAVIMKQLGTACSVPQDEVPALILERREAMDGADGK